MVSLPELGSHRLWREADVIGMQFAGALTLADAQALRALIHVVRGEHGCCYMLADATGLTGIATEARKSLAEWDRSDPDGRISGVGVHGINFAMRVLSIMTLSAVKLMTRRPVSVHFASDEAEARAWISHQRSLTTCATPNPAAVHGG